MTLPAMTFTDEELDVLLLGLALLDADEEMADASDGVADMSEAVRSARARIAAVLPRQRAYRPRKADTPVERTILGAMAAETRLALAYVDGQGVSTQRVVWPVDFDGDTMVAWCESRADFRHFRADRIKTVKDTGTPMPVRLRVLRASLLARGEEDW